MQRTVGPGIAVETVLAVGLWPTLCDPNQLENAILNLCINARDAMPDGGRLTIETANTWLDERAARERDMQPGQYVAICVTDTGTGMPSDVLARAFDPFFTTKPTGQGTGLGLSMIYGFAKQSDGQVRIYSEVGAGTTVRIYLPRHQGDAEDDERDSARTVASGTGGSWRDGVDRRRRAERAHVGDRGVGGIGLRCDRSSRRRFRAEGAAIGRAHRSSDHRCRSARRHEWPSDGRRGPTASARS